MSFVHGHDQRNRYSHWSPLRDAVPAGPGFEIPNRRPTTSLILQPHCLRAEHPATFAEGYARCAHAVRSHTSPLNRITLTLIFEVRSKSDSWPRLKLNFLYSIHFLNHSNLGATTPDRPLSFFNPFPAPTTFPILAGVLRTSHKYDAEARRKRALIVTGTELSGADKGTCIKGLRYLETTGAACALDFLLASYGGCAISTQCTEARQKMRREVETKRRKYDAECFTAMPLELYADDPADVCLGCVSDMKMLHDEAREGLWEDLPRISDLAIGKNWRQ
ncbi:hypothetical protein B0H14DRAFT_3462772 [Mycena olivaceomarginata]|nr:hypothetical protein B0H14DRAFT_3462772 [Mycena olivaceomarginata]